MKIVFLFLCLISISTAFLQYPFVALDILDDLIQSLENDRKTFSLRDTVPGEECKRECRSNDAKVCRFHFMMKYFQVMGG
jgi:hypothetical protein